MDTLSSRIGNAVVVFHCPRVRVLVSAASVVICSAHLHVQGKLWEYCPAKGEGNGQSIGSTVFDAIIGSWLWLTATGKLSIALLQ